MKHNAFRMSARRSAVAGTIGLVTLGIAATGMGSAAASTPSMSSPAVSTVAAGVTVGYPLSYGSRDVNIDNRQVTQLQYLLREFAPTLAVDGQYGPGTQAAVRTFQTKVGLPVNGSMLTNADWTRLFDRNIIGIYAQGNHVRSAQVRLTRIYGPIFGVTVDGSFGPVTERAVKTFQKSSGLEQTGVVNRATWDRLFEGQFA